MQLDALLSLVKEKLTLKFGEAITSSELSYDYPVFTVTREKIEEVLYFLHDDEQLGFRFLTTLCGLHFPDNKGQELAVMYQLHNLEKNTRIRLKTYMPVNDPVVHTMTSLFAAAGWLERETYDFFGIRFTGHPDLRRILNVDEMEGFPMRKEFPIEDQTRDDKKDAMFGR